MRADARRNRDRVLTAARVVFGVDGAEAQMDDVARAAGVGVGTVYRHFPTKEALIAEIVRQTFGAFALRAQEALGREAARSRRCPGCCTGTPSIWPTMRPPGMRWAAVPRCGRPPRPSGTGSSGWPVS